MRKFCCSFLLLIVTVLITGMSVQAAGYRYTPYNSYNYNEWDEAIPSAPGYYPVRYIKSDTKNSVAFDNPVDMYIDKDGSFYILNLKSLDVIILDRDLNLIRQIDKFILPDKSEVALVEPCGLFVKNGLLYIADAGLEEVLISDMFGNVSNVLSKPKNPIFPQDKTFKPQKVMVDKLGNIYVLVKGIYQGAVCFNKTGEFVEFYGSNTVVVTANVLLQRFWRLIMTEEQIGGTANIVPVEYTNFDVDKDGFIYSCTATGAEDTSQIRKLNPLGNNLLDNKQYGDLEYNYYKGTTYKTSFVDVAVNDAGFIYGLDNTRGRIFVYDNEGEEVFIFGSSGNQLGRFQNITALDTYGYKVYVLDGSKNAITEFELTQYGEKVYEATKAYMEGKYTQSQQLWEQVLMQNANYTLAYVGIGKAKYYLGEYESALEYFKRGSDRSQESRTFLDLRKLLLRRYLSVILIVLILLVIAMFIIWRIRKRRRVSA